MRTATSRVMLLQAFDTPLREAQLPVPELEAGGLLVRVQAAGICGSDLELVERRDPRLQSDLLPLIPGHEGVGLVEKTAGDREDLTGRPVRVGDLVIWNRGITCGQCYQCAVRRRRWLCPHRQAYGITLPAREPTWLNGCYAELIYVRPQSELIVLPETTDAAQVVSAACSGATAAHAAELSGVEVGDTVLVIGPGPLGLFCAAFARARGAKEVFVAGSERSHKRLELAEELGCRILRSRDLENWAGRPPDVVMDAAGTALSVRQAISAVGPGGTVVLPGVASPLAQIALDVYADIALKEVRLQGVWVSDARHLYEAVQLALREPVLGRMVTHRFPLSQANEALAAVRTREATKAVLIPD